MKWGWGGSSTGGAAGSVSSAQEEAQGTAGAFSKRDQAHPENHLVGFPPSHQQTFAPEVAQPGRPRSTAGFSASSARPGLCSPCPLLSPHP